MTQPTARNDNTTRPEEVTEMNTPDHCHPAEAIFAEIKKIERRYRRGIATADDALRHLAQALVEPMMEEG